MSCSRRVPPVAWLFLGAFTFNFLTNVMWPAIGAIGCDEVWAPTTTVHPNGTTESGYESLGCAPDTFGSAFTNALQEWPIYNLLWAIVGGQLLFPGGYDFAPILGWTAWVLGWATVPFSLWLGRAGSLWSVAWRIPVAWLTGGLVSLAWLSEWTYID